MKTAVYYSILTGLLLFFQQAEASSPNSALCNDLAKFSCAPGSYNDGTGVVKSENEVLTEVEKFISQSKSEAESQILDLIRSPQQTYFRNLAMSALGLQGAPTCVSQDSSMKQQCEKALVEGLSKLVNRIALGDLMPAHGLVRAGNLREMSHILQHNQFREITKSVTDKARSTLIDKKVVKKIEEKVFPGVRQAMVERIQKMNISKEHRDHMISKINGIVFKGIDCSGAEGDIVSIAEQLVPNALYDPAQNIFKVCAGYLLQSTSEFQIAMTVAHELTHSIDPCRIAAGPEDFGFKYKNKKDFSAMHSEHPMGNVLKCLRTSSSINAKNFIVEDYKIIQKQQNEQAAIQMQLAAQQNYQASFTAKQGAAVNLRAQAGGYLGNEMKTPGFCDDDQIGESFSDWMAAEVLPEYISKNHSLTKEQYQLGYANARRMPCEIKTENNKGKGRYEHPPIEDRINRVIMVNPKIRSQMGCTQAHANISYCDANVEYPDYDLNVVPTSSPIGGGIMPPAVAPAPTPAQGVSK